MFLTAPVFGQTMKESPMNDNNNASFFPDFDHSRTSLALSVICSRAGDHSPSFRFQGSGEAISSRLVYLETLG